MKFSDRDGATEVQSRLLQFGRKRMLTKKKVTKGGATKVQDGGRRVSRKFVTKLQHTEAAGSQ